MKPSLEGVELLLLVVVVLLWIPLCSHAEPQPALDRQLVERIVRALEAQARATERLVQAEERCHR